MQAVLIPLLLASVTSTSAGGLQAAAARKGPEPVLPVVVNARSEREAVYADALIHLALRRVDDAEAAVSRLPTGDAATAELAWRIAVAREDARHVGAAAAHFCSTGDPTGRSCADAELYAGETPQAVVVLDKASEVPLAPSAPVPVTLGSVGDVETGFVVDSGASETVIATSLARRLGLTVTTKAFPVGVAAGGAVVLARLARVPVLRIGGARVENLTVLVMDMPELEANGVQAIISPQHALRGLRVELDFARHRMRLERAGKRPSRRGITVPYYIAGLDLVIAARVGEGSPGLFGLDTGMQDACAVSNDYAPAAPVTGRVELTGAGAQAVAATLPAATVFLGEAALGSGACVRSPLEKVGLPMAGLLGNALWAKGSVTIDTVAHTVTIVTDATKDHVSLPMLPATAVH